MTVPVRKTLSLTPSAAEILGGQRNGSAYVSSAIEGAEREWRQALAVVAQGEFRGERLTAMLRALRGHTDSALPTESEALLVLAREYWRGNSTAVEAIEELT